MANSQTETARVEVCSAHGAYESRCHFGTHWSACPRCEEREKEESMAKMDAARRLARMERRLLLSGLRGRFELTTFENFEVSTDEQRRVLSECRDFIGGFREQRGGGLTLIGRPGTGKSHLGSAMVNALIREHDTAAMILSGREIVRMLRSTWGNRRQPILGTFNSSDSGYIEVSLPDTEDEMLEMLGRVPLLVIDEIGVQFGTDAEMVQLFEVIDRRYQYQLPTVILSNLTGAELKRALGDRAYDRIREGARMLACRWDSHRAGFQHALA